MDKERGKERKKGGKEGKERKNAELEKENERKSASLSLIFLLPSVIRARRPKNTRRNKNIDRGGFV